MIRPYAGYVHSVAQATAPKAVTFVGVTAAGNHGYKINCLSWVWLSPSEKLAYAINISPRNPSIPIAAIDRYCDIKLRSYPMPAGQADSNPPADMTFTPDEGAPVTDTGTTTVLPQEPNPTELPPAYSSNTPGATNPIVTASTNFGPTGNVTSTTSGNTTSTPLLTPQQETALFSAVGGILNTTGTAIAAAIQSNNQMQLAQMQARTQIEIATLQAESQRSMAAGNMNLAQQQIQQMGQLQQFNGVLSAQSQQTIAMYVIGGIAVLALIGAVVFFIPKGPSSTPVAPVTSTSKPSRSTRSKKR